MREEVVVRDEAVVREEVVVIERKSSRDFQRSS